MSKKVAPPLFKEATSANQRSAEVVMNLFCKQDQQPAKPAEPACTNEDRRGYGPPDTSPEGAELSTGGHTYFFRYAEVESSNFFDYEK